MSLSILHETNAQNLKCNTLSILATTQAVSTSTGGLTLVGGLAVAKDAFLGADVKILGTKDATSASTGSLVVSYGIGCGNIVAAATIESRGALYSSSTIDSTSTDSGALQVDGGMGVAKDSFFGGNVRMIFNADALSPSSGTLVCAGGIGCSNLVAAGTIESRGALYSSSTLDSTSVSSGALQVDGGAGIAKDMFVGGAAHLVITTESTSISTGACIVAGGLGVAKSIIVGGVLKGTLTTDSADSTTGACIFAGGVGIAKNLNIAGALTKGSGSFLIPHPDPSKEGWKLRHCFVESPTRGDNLYRFEVETHSGVGCVALPSYFKFLNEDVQIFVSPKDQFISAYGGISEDMSSLIVKSQCDGIFNVLIVGTRKDKIAKDYFDAEGCELAPK